MSRFTAALRWAFWTALLLFSIAFSTPLIIGGPGASLAPVFAFLLAPVVFCFAFVLALIQPRLGKIMLLVTLALGTLAIPWYWLEMPKGKAPTLLPLTIEERELLHSTRFDLRVAVTKGRFPEVYQRKLVVELNEMGIFKEVGRVGDVDSPDLIATPLGQYYGDQEGERFSLQLSAHPEQKLKVEVKVWRYIWGIPSMLSDRYPGRTRYRERLAIEVIRKVDELRSLSTGS